MASETDKQTILDYVNTHIKTKQILKKQLLACLVILFTCCFGIGRVARNLTCSGNLCTCTGCDMRHVSNNLQ